MERRTVKNIPSSWAVALMLAAILSAAARCIGPGKKKADPPSPPAAALALDQAAMCEEIREYSPVHSAVAFSISVGEVSCFTRFDPVPEKTVTYHLWYHRDELSTTKRLTLKPPRWATFSTIQLRQADKGPWRVEITDAEKQLMKILRFSVTD